MLGTKKGSADETLITTENGMRWTDKGAGKVCVHWALITVLYRERSTIHDLLFGSVWFRSKCSNHHPNAVTTIVAPGATFVATQATQLR